MFLRNGSGILGTGTGNEASSGMGLGMKYIMEWNWKEASYGMGLKVWHYHYPCVRLAARILPHRVCTHLCGLPQVFLHLKRRQLRQRLD